MEAASVQAGTPVGRRSRGISERRLAAYMVSPSLLLIALVAAYPIGYAIWLSLHEYSVRVAGLSRWAGTFGLRNYSNILQDPEFWAAVKTTFIFTAFSVTFACARWYPEVTSMPMSTSPKIALFAISTSEMRACVASPPDSRPMPESSPDMVIRLPLIVT